jgi:hypothetical protein
MRRYLATYEYTETVKGEERTFVHESIIEVGDGRDAHAAAVEYFDSMGRASQIGWGRVLKSCAVKPAPRGAMPKGGTRIEPAP